MSLVSTYDTADNLVAVNGSPLGAPQAVEDVVDEVGGLTKTLDASGQLVAVDGAPWDSPEAMEAIADELGLTKTTNQAGALVAIDGYPWSSSASFRALVDEAAASIGQLVIIAGQSNAVGRGIAERVDPDGHVGLRSAYSAVQMSAMIGDAGTPPEWDFELTARDLQPYTTGGTPSMGVELTLGRMLYEAGLTDTFVGKFAMNSASLAGHYADAGVLAEFVDYISAAIDDAGQELGVLVWIQGETDAASEAHANAYADNLAALMASLRGEFGNFRLVIVKLNEGCSSTYTDELRDSQDAYALTDDRCVLVAADDLPLSDGLHYDEEEIAALGYRIGEAILAQHALVDVEPDADYMTFVGAAPGAYGSGALSPPAYPHVDGDVLVLVASGGLTDAAPSLSTAAGYTSIVTGQSSVDLGSGLLYQNARAWYLRADQATMESSGGQMPLPVVADNHAAGAARIFVFRPPAGGTLTGSPVDDFSTGANNNYFTEITTSGHATTGANRLIAYFTTAFTGGDNTLSTLSNGNLSSVTEQADSYYLVGSDREMISLVTGRMAVAGEVGNATGTISNSGIISALCVSLKP